MAVKAFILIEAYVGESGKVAEEVRQLAGVKSADPVIGQYDVIAGIEVAEFEMVDSVINKVHSVPGVIRTTTLLAVKS